MKIEDPRSVNSSSGLRPIAPAPTRAEGRQGQPEARQAGQPAARVEISSRSRDLHEALAAAKAAPDVRADKVAEARQRIANGTYSVDAETVARRMLDTRA